MRFRLGCELSYRVESDTAFLFNIAVQHFEGQAIESERLTLTPALPLEE